MSHTHTRCYLRRWIGREGAFAKKHLVCTSIPCHPVRDIPLRIQLCPHIRHVIIQPTVGYTIELDIHEVSICSVLAYWIIRSFHIVPVRITESEPMVLQFVCVRVPWKVFKVDCGKLLNVSGLVVRAQFVGTIIFTRVTLDRFVAEVIPASLCYIHTPFPCLLEKSYDRQRTEPSNRCTDNTGMPLVNPCHNRCVWRRAVRTTCRWMGFFR